MASRGAGDRTAGAGADPMGGGSPLPLKIIAGGDDLERMTADPGGSAVARPAALTPFLAVVVLVAVPSVVVGAIVAGLAIVAQHRWADEFGPDVRESVLAPVASHTFVMVLLFWLLVVVARSLWGAGGGRVLAIVIVSLAAFGPMSLAAVPAFAAVYADDQVMAPWWPGALALVWTVLAVATALWSLRWFPATGSGSWLERHRWLVGVVALVAVYAASSTVADFWLDPGHTDLDAQMQLGWMLLAAGLVTGAATTSSLGTRIGMVLLAPTVIGGLYVAYSTGGWPGVAGWEGAQAPLYSTIGVGVLVCSAPLLGWAVGLVGHAVEVASHGRTPRQAGTILPTA